MDRRITTEITELKQIQDLLYGALCYFDDVCRRENIRYFLSNGTLLGAAKYGDFIPWDDDVDVLMPREDYDRLMGLTTINNGQYRLLCKEQVAEWRMPYAKLSCENTVIQEGDYNFGTSFGVAVDIFPIDNWSSSLPIAKLQAFESECLKRLLICSIGGSFSSQKTGLKRFILKGIWVTGKALGYQRIQRWIFRRAKKRKSVKSAYVGCRAWTCHLDGEVFPADYFADATELEFRGRRFPVIPQYEQYLSSLYGDWRAELPPEKQCSNHEIRVWYKDAE